ncbi:MAG: divergent polysaccharide deacetylase family protein [Pseudomonadales bacterium]
MNRASLVLICLLGSLLGIPNAAADSAPAHLAIVVDDLGYSLERAARAMALPGPVTLGLLPFAPESGEIAQRARQSGHEVILHQPMESLPEQRTAAHGGFIPGTLTVGMSPERFDAQMDAALAALPGVVGLNNHTGSRLTQDHAAMRRVMQHLAQRELLFLDSRTTADTVAYRMAREARIPALKRDVFLDHEPHGQSIALEFQRALGIARQQGFAVIIAHPHTTSLDFLARALGRLPGDIRMVSLRELARQARPEAPVLPENPEFLRRSLGQ